MSASASSSSGATGASSSSKGGGILSALFRVRDWSFLIAGVRIKKGLADMVDKNVLADVQWGKSVSKYGKREAMIFEGITYSFEDLDELANQIAHFALAQGLKAGDTVALFMENRPEYFVVWMGLAKVGVRTALINFNLRLRQLVHSFSVCDCKLIIYGAEQTDKMAEILDDLGDVPKYSYHAAHTPESPVDFAKGLNAILDELPRTPVPPNERASAKGVRVAHDLLYVYTSGTTGMPKAAVITCYRFLIAATAFSTLFNINHNDRIYCTLPLFHSSGGLIGLGAMVVRGSSIILRRKFSASAFIEEARANNATVVQYIGELLRYVVATPPRADDRQHSIRLALGNGLRPDVWKQFDERFKVPVVGEFYAASEGAGALVNTTGHMGAVGFISPLVNKVLPSRIIRYDVEKDEIIRGPDGLCQICDPGEAGEYVAEILVEKGGVSTYSGYKDESASKKKVIHDVVKKGDSWFRSGDLLRMDGEGHVYFVDRIGDTFRFRGENVSTAEVAEVMAYYGEFKADNQINVYGVEVPGYDGRCGMAAIEADPAELDLAKLAAHVNDQLAAYSRPRFLRFQVGGLDQTATFKHTKVGLKKEGFDPSAIDDPLFYLNDGMYKPLTKEVYEGICAGSVRL